MSRSIEIKLTQPSISPSVLQEILYYLEDDVLDEVLELLKENDIEIYE